MSALDNIGKIAAAQIAFYTPIAAYTLYLIFRYAFRRDGGWFWLFIFSAGNSTNFILFCFILTEFFQERIASGALVIAGELLLQTNLLLAAYILEYAGLAFLLLSSLGFIGMA